MKKTNAIVVPSLGEQKRIVEEKKIALKNNINFKNVDDAIGMTDSDEIPDSWKSFKQGYVPPTPDEIRKTFSGFSSAELADMFGLSNGRIIRRWKSGENEIPYAAWRLFLIITERVVL